MSEFIMRPATFEGYTSAVDEGRWPDDPRVPLPDPFRNNSGVIQNLLLKPCRSVAAIHSVKGSVRANHYHKTDWHYAFVVSGCVYYFERAVGESRIGTPYILRAGHMFFTPPMREHAMLFVEETTIITLAKNVRSHEEHEADLVRVAYVTPEIARERTASHDESWR